MLYLFDDIANMQKALLVYHPSVQDTSYGQLTTLHLERHALQHNSTQANKT